MEEKPPKRIWLQFYDEDGEVTDDITWCEDRQFETDVEYRIANQ